MSKQDKSEPKELTIKLSDVGDGVYEVVEESIIEKTLELLPEALAPFLNGLVDTLVQHGIGVVSPRLGSLYLSIKVARAERNMREFSNQLRQLTEEIQDIRAQINDTDWLRRARLIMECSIDAVLDEIDVDKIRYFALGTVRAFERDQLDPILHQHLIGLLKQCSSIDMLILRDADDPEERVNMTSLWGRAEWAKKRGLTNEAVELSVQNLRRLGLFDDGSLETIQELLDKVQELENRVKGMSAISMTLPMNRDWNALSVTGKTFVDYFRDWIEK